jgi:hypothetical protein
MDATAIVARLSRMIIMWDIRYWVQANAIQHLGSKGRISHNVTYL